MGWTLFDLVITAGAYGANLRLAGADPQQATEILVPPAAQIQGGGQVTVPVKVRPRSRRWFGSTLQRTFGILVGDAGGGSGVTFTATGSYDDLPRGWPVVGPILGIGAGVLIPVGLAAAGVFSGGGGGASPDPTDTPTKEASPSPTDKPETPTDTPETPTDTVVPTPTDTPAPDGYIEDGDWTYTFIVDENTCGFGLGPGEEFVITYTFEDFSGDDIIEPGELFDITDENGFYAGAFEFTYPHFSFGYPVVGNNRTVDGYLTIDNEFTSPTSTAAQLTEVYETSPECYITAN
jgi:hypothetical protein